MIERQVIVTWYTPEEKMPPEGECVVVTVSGLDENIIYDHALQIGMWADDGCGWLIEGFTENAKFGVLAWCDIMPYGYRKDRDKAHG